MVREIYLDNNATTKPLAEVRAAMVDVLGDEFGNPSSSHASGERARLQLRKARSNIAQILGVEGDQIVFCGSGTEANNLVLRSAVYRNQRSKCRIVTTAIEHSSVLKLAEHLHHHGVEIVTLPVSSDGCVDLEHAKAEITSDTTLVSAQWVNNETGVIQPIESIGGICRSKGVSFHTDAAQAVGKLPTRVAEMPVDLLSMTAHKLHGPQGVGAVYARNPKWLTPQLFGGPQEEGLRAGTENLPGIVGFGKAAEVRTQNLTGVSVALTGLRDTFEERVQALVPDVCINGEPSGRVCNTTNLRFAGIDGQALVARLDQEGIRCSQSSACTNRRPEPSYVLRAMGLSEEEAYASVRFSFGVDNTKEEVQIAAEAIRDICQQLRAFSNRLQNPYQFART